MTALCFICLLIAVPTGIVGAICMINLARDLNCDQKREYKINRNAPTWLEGDK